MRISKTSPSRNGRSNAFSISRIYRVDTAGGDPSRGDKKEGGESLHTVRFRGVNNADEIRTLITERLGELKDCGLGIVRKWWLEAVIDLVRRATGH